MVKRSKKAVARKRRPRRKAGGNGVNGARPINRSRRTKAEIEGIKYDIFDIVEAENPCTVRQVFYQLVSMGTIDKTEAEYKNVVCRLLVTMRRAQEIPFGWIADSTRWMRKPDTYGSLQGMLREATRTYRRALWGNQDSYVEIWCEKEALAGVFADVTDDWDVPLMVTRGFPSLSFVYEAAETIEEMEKPTYLYYFGDHDPSGVHIDRVIKRGIADYAPRAEFYFERVAVKPEQLDVWDLPTRPTKKTDSRARNFEGESVEVDAIAPAKLRELAAECIAAHIDNELLERTRNVEEAERETLETILDKLRDDDALDVDDGE